MSHLANAIDQLMIEKKKTGSDIQKATKLNATRISRWKNGQQEWISSEDLVLLAGAFDGRPETHALLLYARLQDECKGPGARFVNIKISPTIKVQQVESESFKNVLAPKARADLQTISEHIASEPHILEMVHALAQLCRKESLTQAH